MATKSSVVSGMGVALSLIQSLVASVKKVGGTDEDIHRLSTQDANGVWDKIATLVVEAGKKAKEVFTFVVDYGRSLADAVKAGRYDYANDDITDEHFPAEEWEKGKKEQSFKLYHFGKEMESDDVVVQMDNDGFRPATVRELLAFGEKNPELQRQFPIIALKQFWVNRYGFRGVVYLGRSGARRLLSLSWCGGGCLWWGGSCRFLAVSK